MSQTVGNIVGNFLQEQIDHLKWCCEDKTDGLDKVCRVAVSIIDIVGLTYGKGEAGQNLRGRIKNLRDVWAVFQPLFRLQYWIGKPSSEPGKPVEEPDYLKDPWWTVASQAVYGKAQLLESIKHLGSWGLLDLVKAAKAITDGTTLQHLQGLPVISIVIDILYTSSASIVAVDRAIALAKGRRITKMCDFKLSKWTRGEELYRLAFPKDGKPNNLGARSQLLDIYERKICLNQLKIQSGILTYTLATKFDGILKNKDKQYLAEDESEEKLLSFGNSLLADIKGANSENINAKDMLRDIEFFERRLNDFGGLTPALRQLALSVSNEIFNLNGRLVESDSSKAHKNATKTMKAKQINEINRLFIKVNKEQRIYQSLAAGSDETSRYFEWKRHKWTVKKMEHTLKTDKNIYLLVDMTLKVVGGALGLAFTFNPIGAAFGSTVAPILTQSQVAQAFKRECWKVALSSAGGFFGYYSLFETEKKERELKAYKAASVYKDEKGDVKKPVFDTLEPLENPLAQENKALDPKAKFKSKQVSAQIVEILALTDRIRCRRFGDRQRLEMRRGMFNAKAA